MRVLHISDLHFSQSSDIERVLSALFADVAEQNSESSIDVVVFSGDLFSKGNANPEKTKEAVDSFFKPLRASLHDNIPVVICPGNHDMALRSRDALYDPIFASVNSPSEASKLVGRAAKGPQDLWGHINEFNSLARHLDSDAYQNHPLYYTKKLEVDGHTFGFASINSAWKSIGGGNADYGGLFVGDEQITLALSEIKDCECRIAVMHHTLDWLPPAEKSTILRSLTLNFHLVLCGHNHDNNAHALTSNIGNLFVSNTGCLYASEEYYNGYSIIDIDSNFNIEVRAREYYFQRRKFDVCTRFAKDGKLFQPSAISNEARAVIISPDVLAATQDRANSLLLSYSSSEVAPKSLGAIFVEPPIYEVSEEALAGEKSPDASKKPIAVPLSEIAALPESIVFFGKRESGKSLLLHHVAVNKFLDFKKDARIGIVIDVAATRTYTRAAFLDNALQFAQNEISKRELSKLLHEGHVVVCVDNFRLGDERLFKGLKEFIDSFPKSRYIFSVQEVAIRELATEHLPGFGIALRRFFIHPFEQKHTKELAQKWFGDTDVANPRIQLLDRLITTLRVPRTPFLVSVLLWVLEQRPGSNLINHASAIEVLIEGLLDKLKESNARQEFDSTIQQHFLSEFAAKLDDLDLEWLETIEFEEFVVQYFKKRGLNYATSNFYKSLIKKGVLYESGNQIGFKFDCFRAYFLAKKFAVASARWEGALNSDRAHKYATEIDLFTGLYRDRADVLKAALNLAETFETEFFSRIPLHLSYLDRLGDGAAAPDARLLEAIERTVLNPELEENSDVDPDVPPPAPSVNEEESRKRRILPNTSEIARTLEQLRVCSYVIRNSELVEDVDLKRQVFEKVMNLWSRMTLVTLATIVEAKKEDLELHDENGKRFVISDELRYLVRVIVPQAFISFMIDSLATPKLKIFTDELVISELTMVRIMAVYLSLASGDAEGVSHLKKLLKDNPKNAFVNEMTFFRLVQIYVIGRQRTPELRNLLADLFAKLRGWNIHEESALKARFLTHLDNQSKPFG